MCILILGGLYERNHPGRNYCMIRTYKLWNRQICHNKMARIYQKPLQERHHFLPHKMVNSSTVDIGIFLYYTGFDTQMALITA